MKLFRRSRDDFGGTTEGLIPTEICLNMFNKRHVRIRICLFEDLKRYKFTNYLLNGSSAVNSCTGKVFGKHKKNQIYQFAK